MGCPDLAAHIVAGAPVVQAGRCPGPVRRLLRRLTCGYRFRFATATEVPICAQPRRAGAWR